MNFLKADKYILSALNEDITDCDITTEAIMTEDKLGEAYLYAKAEGIICGLEVFERVYYLYDNNVKVEKYFKDGDLVKPGDVIAKVIGNVKSILIGERTALNYLQRMSGIATKTNSIVKLLEGSKTKLLDTRKTTPNMRIFEKYAVSCGGGVNHRFNLSDGILIKDNHIDAAGSITKAVEKARKYAYSHRIEVEVETLDEVREAVNANVDIIMLDNMDKVTMIEALNIIDKRAITECSGNMDYEKINLMKEIGVDYISSGAITYNAKILDVSLKNLKVIENSEI